MATTVTLPRAEPFVLRFDSKPAPMTDEELFEFCRLNEDWRIERTAEGDLIVMPPAGGETGHWNAGLTALLWLWAEADGTGLAFDSSTGFILPNGAKRSPDASWVLRSRWDRVQGTFVDEPRAAVEEADQLVGQAIQRLSDSFTDARGYDEFARLLEQRGSVDYMRARIEALEDECLEREQS